jgi:predicted RNase H-like nuclease (RuvC/YqgF family)
VSKLEICNNTRKYSFKLSDVADMVQEFADEIETLEDELDTQKELNEGKDIEISEKDSEIAYLKSMLDRNEIDY